jgi:hypothetical protein
MSPTQRQLYKDSKPVVLQGETAAPSVFAPEHKVVLSADVEMSRRRLATGSGRIHQVLMSVAIVSASFAAAMGSTRALIITPI